VVKGLKKEKQMTLEQRKAEVKKLARATYSEDYSYRPLDRAMRDIDRAKTFADLDAVEQTIGNDNDEREESELD
jgi:hypothetical protein